MKRSVIFVYSAFLLFLAATSAHALLFNFSDNDFLGGASWGTMTITQAGSTLQVQYTASTNLVIPAGSQVTGFGFNFSTLPTGITNPANADFANDRNDLVWVPLANLNPIPQPANGDQFVPNVTKFDYNYGATEGNDNNFSPPGILPGETDIFSLNFSGANLPGDLTSLLLLTGIRLQSLPENINGGSLFLAGARDPNGPAPVPEPATMFLLGSGLVGLAGAARRKFKK